MACDGERGGVREGLVHHAVALGCRYERVEGYLMVGSAGETPSSQLRAPARPAAHRVTVADCGLLRPSEVGAVKDGGVSGLTVALRRPAPPSVTRLQEPSAEGGDPVERYYRSMDRLERAESKGALAEALQIATETCEKMAVIVDACGDDMFDLEEGLPAIEFLCGWARFDSTLLSSIRQRGPCANTGRSRFGFRRSMPPGDAWP